ncbi:MAG TPA: right-handed parallel beta-helix repeat-containing protein [Solirubrobacteraceae bacterium]|nr:right-handed parallel beta-helix repeat-containing protein [Solirubrobacteraceae bacterium]
MRRLVVGCALAGTLWLVSSASAAAVVTRYVDDDHAQCPQATFTKIQAAIDASAAHDIVRVCAGTYREQLTLPADKPALMVASLPALAAHVMAPAGGATSEPDTVGPGSRTDLISVLGSEQHVLGLSISGPITPHVVHDGCGTASAIADAGADTVLDGNVLTGLSDNPCPDPNGPFPTTDGIRLDYAATAAVIERSTIQGAVDGIELGDGHQVLAERNVIVGRGAASPGYGVDGGGIDTSLRSNDISATSIGMVLYEFSGLAKGNELHDNGTGLELGDGVFATTIDSNIIHANRGDGLLTTGPGEMGAGSSGLIRGNDVRSNGHDGISVNGCPSHCDIAQNSFQVDRNISLGNGHYDCFDSVPAVDVWTNDIGVTDSPSTICSPH